MADEELTEARVAAARDAGRGVVLTTPVLPVPDLADRLGRPVVVKAENLQRTGSFKVRGAMARIAALGPAAARGVVAGSAGNHARAVAHAAREAGIACTIFMPIGASITKADACTALGADVRMDAPDVDAAVAAARTHAEASGQAFVHPYADLDVIAGQATVGTELVEQVPDLDTVIVPLGGGGLAAGVAWAVRAAHPRARIVAVQARACAPWPALLAGTPPADVPAVPTLADGIRVASPDPLTRRLLDGALTDVVVVDEDEIADAVVWLFETTKLVVEGAGAVGVAALQQPELAPSLRGPNRHGAIAVILSGGNIDPGLLGDAIRRHETRAGRRLVLRARLDDRPGTLAHLCRVLADAGANVVDIQHLREGVALHFGQTAIQAVAQVRGPAHGEAVIEAARAAGLDVHPLGVWPS